MTGIDIPDYVTEPIFHQWVKPYMNDPRLVGAWSDKCYLDKFVGNCQTPNSIIRNVNGRFLGAQYNLISRDMAQIIINEHDRLVVKPAIFAGAGRDVQLRNSPIDLNEIDEIYRENYIMQLPIVQHAEFSKLNSSSVNTIRVNTVLLGTEVYIMSAFLKVGQEGEFADNSGYKRYFIGIKENGIYMDYAIDHDLNKYNQQLPNGFLFVNKEVPFWNEICNTVIDAHKKIPHFGFAFWDVCIKEDGTPIIIELNLRNPNINIAQIACGPFFGKYTKQIMEFVKSTDV